MNCVILQPSYIPWRGYFHQISLADVFVFLDDVQYDRRGWRNRNRVKTQQGSRWLTIPVLSKGSRQSATPIIDIRINWDQPWNEQHLTTLRHSYGKSPFFLDYTELLEGLYSTRPTYLADFTIDFTIALSRELGIQDTQFLRSSQLPAVGTKTDLLLSILSHVGATHYISGPSAEDYIDAEMFQRANISLEYMKYDYPEYEQCHPPFDPQVSVLDLMFATGVNSPDYIWGNPSLSHAKCPRSNDPS